MKTDLFQYVLIVVFSVCRGFIIGSLGHVKYVKHGGSVGFGIQLKHLAPIKVILSHTKFIPGHQQISNQGGYQHPYHVRPHQPHIQHYERPQNHYYEGHQERLHTHHYEGHHHHHERPHHHHHEGHHHHHERPHNHHYEGHHERPYNPHYEGHHDRPPKRPHHEKPDSSHHQKPNKPHHEKPDRPDYEMPVKPIDEQPHEPDNNKEPKLPKTETPIVENEDPKKDDLPNFEYIGEYPEDDLPIEDIIQPRKRPKRFIESNTYHIPVQFRSNAKAYKVQTIQEE